MTFETGFRLAGVPGFHEARRAVFDGTLEGGGIVLAIYCTCDDSRPAARIEAFPDRADPFLYARVESDRIQLSPALDIQSGAGHFITQPVWELTTESLPATMARGKALRGKFKGTAPASEVRAARPSTVAMPCPHGKCLHELGLHSPCSVCGCPNITDAKAAKRKR